MILLSYPIKTSCLIRHLSHRSIMSLSAQVNIARLNKTVTVPTGLFINNEFVPSVDSQELIQSVLVFDYLILRDLSTLPVR